MKNTIFIQLASYRDPQLLPTLRDCIEKSKNPENLIFSIAHQYNPDDTWDNLDEFKNDKRFKIVEINYKDAKGVCWARHLLQQNYNGEKYTLQLDSHHRFIENWDEELILMYEALRMRGYSKPLITGYVPSFDPDNDPQSRIHVPWKMNFDRFSPEGVIHFIPSSIDNYKEINEPIPSRFYSGHFAFTTGDFVKEVPHDPNYYFHGEEISIAVRAFTWGYDLFHPHRVILWHESPEKRRKNIGMIVRNGKRINNLSFARNRKLFGMDGEIVNNIDFGIYGFGTIRSLEDYEKYSGISFKKRSIQQYTMDNKNPPNPQLSDEEYEKSFMRIFKHCIDIRYDQVVETDYDFWVVAFHREGEGDTTLYRKDADVNEIKRMMDDPDKYCKIWREFKTTHKPKYWVVWPHSQSKGWCERITGDL